jgi:PilZ domain-containing protein
METKTEAGINAAIDRSSLANLVAQLPLLVLDVSHSGCLLETQQPVEAGRVGTLRLALNGGWYVEDIRVTRCQAVSGRGSTYHIGVEFLRTRRLPDQSLRHAVGQMIGGAAKPDPEVKWTIRHKERQ